MYSHDHGGILHNPATRAELLDGAGGIERPGPPVTEHKSVSNSLLELIYTQFNITPHTGQVFVATVFMQYNTFNLRSRNCSSTMCTGQRWCR